MVWGKNKGFWYFTMILLASCFCPRQTFASEVLAEEAKRSDGACWQAGLGSQQGTGSLPALPGAGEGLEQGRRRSTRPVEAGARNPGGR